MYIFDSVQIQHAAILVQQFKVGNKIRIEKTKKKKITRNDVSGEILKKKYIFSWILTTVGMEISW